MLPFVTAADEVGCEDPAVDVYAFSEEDGRVDGGG